MSFCTQCGAALHARPHRAATEERRVVTVLFVDMAGFTSRAERLDPEDVRAILQPYFARLRLEIEAFGGTVEKFIGDAVMAVFGAPLVHGDDPERAVRAAFAIRDGIADMNAKDPELDLHIRLAVNTGEAIVALDAKPTEGEGMVAGDVVNTASRLQSLAPEDAILVGEETYRCTRSIVEYREVDPLAVKGKHIPVRAWLALSCASSPGERAAKSELFVGRDHELTALHRLWQASVAERRAQLVTVVGEAGIGKSRLAAEFCGQVAEQGGRSLRGRVLPYGASTPYGPFTQHVKQRAGIFASDSLPTAREKLRAAVATLIDHDVETTVSHLEMLIGLGSDGEVPERRMLFFSARQFVQALADEQPTVLLLEDLHWADEGMLDLLELLASRVRDVPLLLLALARPDLLEARPRWGGGLPAYTALQLKPLERTASEALVAGLLAEAREDTADLDAGTIVQRAEGNPLFLEELAAALAERQGTPGDDFPTSVRGIVAARLDALPAAERGLLLDAAVVGKVFWLGALERMGDNHHRLADILDSLEARNLVSREPASWIEGDQQFAFKHVVIREVAYAAIPRGRRRERHATVAGFLETATGGGGATASALAQHWQEAGDAERAVRYLLLAAEQAGRGWAKEEAAALYKQALVLVPEADRELRREVAMRRAVAMQAAMHVADARSLGRRPESESGEA